jgi:hypothetical protein
MRVAVAGQPVHPLDLTVDAESGVVLVPDDRDFSGRRDVVFTLLRDDGSAYSNSGASYTVTDLVIAGSR